MAWKSHYANELEVTASRFHTVSGSTKCKNNLSDNWSEFPQTLATAAYKLDTTIVSLGTAGI